MRQGKGLWTLVGGGHHRHKKTKPWKCGDFDANFHGLLKSKQAGTCFALTSKVL